MTCFVACYDLILFMLKSKGRQIQFSYLLWLVKGR